MDGGGEGRGSAKLRARSRPPLAGSAGSRISPEGDLGRRAAEMEATKSHLTSLRVGRGGGGYRGEGGRRRAEIGCRVGSSEDTGGFDSEGDT